MKKNIIIFFLVLSLSASIFAYSSKLEEKLFYNMGYFGTVFLYQSYLNIGMTSDLWVKNIYTANNAKVILRTVKNFLVSSIKNFKGLVDFNMLKDDRDTLLKLGDIAEDLESEVDFMIRYMDTRDKEDLAGYEKFRKSAWSKLKGLVKRDQSK